MAPAQAPAPPQRVAIVGAGWAGLAAAVRAVQRGHHVCVFEAARHVGGRARALPLRLPDGRDIRIDNGQHILIGAYTETLALMRDVGVNPEQALLRHPLDLRYIDGSGLALPDWPQPFNLLWGVARAKGWRWRERLALLRRASAWQRSGFACPPHTSVAQLVAGLPERLVRELIEPLCVSALNTPLHQASGAVFLRVLRDALFSTPGGSDLLLPRTDLGRLLPEAAAAWLQAQGAELQLGQRVDALHWQPDPDQRPRWRLNQQAFDHVIWATAAPHAAQAMQQSAAHAPPAVAEPLLDWAQQAARVTHRPITSIYAQITPLPSAHSPALPRPMLALRNSAQAPAQFVFERDALCPSPQATGLLCFVISDSQGSRPTLEAAVVAQAQQQLGLCVQPLFALTEKRATFACSTDLTRPSPHIAPGLSACGDYIEGPYPATLEGAVRSGLTLASDLGRLT